MTITETAPEAEMAGTPQLREDSGYLASLVGTGDHKRIGRLFLGGSLLGLLATLTAGTLLSVERVSSTSAEILDVDILLQVESFHRLGLVLLFALPAFLGLALVVVPLQVGSSTVAFGRAAALSFWGWALGVALWIAGYLVGGGPGGSDLRGTDLWLLANIMVITSLLVATGCVLATILGLRTTGMTLRQVPAFSFSMLVAGSIWLLTLPFAIANLVVVYLDHRYGQVGWGTNDLIFRQLSWLVSQPQIFAIAIPVLGIAAEQIPVFSRARQRFSSIVFIALGLFGALAIGAWAQSALVPTNLFDDPIYVAFGVLIILPVLMVLSLGGDTMRAGKVKVAAPLLLALAGGLALLAATVAGAVYVIEPLELFDTTWRVGQIQLTVFASVLAIFSGIWFWSSKIYGRQLPDGIPMVAAPLLLLASLLATAPLLAAGLLEQIDSVLPGEGRDGVTALNSAAAAGSVLVLVLVLALIATTLRGRGATDTPDDPWGGHTLEWATASPPPVGNFAEAPVVTDERPLFTDPAEEDAS